MNIYVNNRTGVFAIFAIVVLIALTLFASCVPDPNYGKVSPPEKAQTQNMPLIAVFDNTGRVYRFNDGLTVCYVAFRNLGNDSPSIWCAR